MQYDENAEKYGYEGEMTPIECDELKSYKGDVYIPVYGSIADAEVYLKKDVDKTLAEKDKEIAELKKKLMPCLNGDCILTCEVIEKYGKENAELKQKLEDVNELVKESKELLKESQKMHQRCADNASKQIRRLKRALWLARAEWARSSALSYHLIESHPDKDVAATYKRKANKWEKAKDKCLKKAEEYK